MKIKQIGAIVLTTPIWWDNYNMASKVRAEVENTINGGVIVYEQALLTSSENIDLASGDGSTGWQTATVKDALLAHVNGSLGINFNITTTDDTVIACRYRHEAGAMAFERVVDALTAEYFTCEIKLAKV